MTHGDDVKYVKYVKPGNQVPARQSPCAAPPNNSAPVWWLAGSLACRRPDPCAPAASSLAFHSFASSAKAF